MMEAFDKAKHIPMLDSWYLARGMAPFPPESYPRHGFIADGYAAGFLMQTDTDLCMIDLLISNPKATLSQRARAVTDCICVLICLARDLGFKRMAVETNSTGVRNFAKRCGMTIRKGTHCLEGDLAHGAP